MKRIRSSTGGHVKRKRSKLACPQVSDDDQELDESYTRNEALKSLIDKKVEKAVKNLMNESKVASDQKPHKLLKTEILIPDFDPENKDINVKGWINKIEQLGDIYKWSDELKSFNLQAKLQGQARVWFNRLDFYDHTWEEWKLMLIKAFPRFHDYATLLDELMNRKKLTNESMTKYFQEKLAMCYRCQLSDQASVSCIIRGLPQELQANAQAFQCTSPDELYEGFLSAFDNYQATNPGKTIYAPVKYPYRALDSSTSQASKETTSTRKPPICFRCNQTGHVAPNCTLPDKRKCFKCGKLGHVATSCTAAEASTSSQEKKVQILSNLNDTYNKTARVNGVFMKAYIDTGSELNVMAKSAAEAMQLPVKDSDVILKGFAGGSVKAAGEISFNLGVDGIEMDTRAVITDADLGNIVLIIGQPIINNQNVILNVSNNTSELRQVTTDELSSVDTVYEAIRFRVQAAEDTEVPVGDSLVKVALEGASQGNYCTKPRHFSMGAVSYAIASTVLQGGGGYLRVCNMGEEPVKWNKGYTITRAERCEVEAAVSSNILSLRRGESESIEQIGGVSLEQIKVCPVDSDSKTKLIKLLAAYADCFASSTKEIGSTNLGQMRINLTTEKPINRKPYRLSHAEREIVSNKIEELLEGNIIRESSSEYASPIILVRKNNGDYRLCVDYRDLNAITVKERFPLPHIDDELSRLAGKKLFTSLDLFSGYHHISIEPESIDKTAFVTPDGHFEYLKVPFGLANSPSVFMRVMQKLVKLVGSNEIIAFMNDHLLATVDVNDGLILLEKVLIQLRSANLKLNMQKCSFLQSEVSFLGHEISSEGIKPGNRKIEVVEKFPTPKNLHELRQFLGLCSYFRKYIYQYALLAKPLTDLTKKSSEWSWGGDQIKSFETFKTKLCLRPVLALFDLNLPCEIHTDACKNGIAGILFQTQSCAELKPVFYFSTVTSREESIYHSYELEMLAVVESLKHFRVYIYGKPVKFVTDCSAVRHTLEKKDMIPRIARWWLTIQEFDMSIEYRPCDHMRHVDALSRNPIHGSNPPTVERGEGGDIPNTLLTFSPTFKNETVKVSI